MCGSEDALKPCRGRRLPLARGGRRGTLRGMPSNRARIIILSAMCLLMFAPAGVPVAAAAAEQPSDTDVTFGRTSARLNRTANNTTISAGGTSATLDRSGNRTRVSVQSPPRGREARTRTTVQRGRWAGLAVSRSDALTKLQEARKLQAEKRALALKQLERSRSR